VLLGEVRERPDLSKRDRGLIIVAAPVAGQRHTEPPGHARRALCADIVERLPACRCRPPAVAPSSQWL
jgi:alkylhydroperoxidase/carboxymuconolactone decarboxylase family protein YurZ